MKIKENVSLKNFSYWKVGGEAKYVIEVDSVIEIKKAINLLNNKKLSYLVVGNTTNLLFSSDGFDGGLIKLGDNFSFISFNKDSISVGASVYAPNLVRNCINNSLKGVEHLIGVPATIGGAVNMNAGSQRKSISDNVISVTSMNTDGEIIIRKKKECEFQYRKSIFQNNSEVILSVELKLDKGEKKELRKECLNILRDRSNKFPRKLPSCGSVFVSNPSMYAEYGPPGKIIEDAGLKGAFKGGAAISTKHANFIVNNGGASSDDILYLINLACQKVYENTGYDLESEAIYVSRDGKTTPAHLKAAELN